ncbi:hypothetical protein Hanom_Chr10g00933211 [Helianthus anomalus]
MILNLVVKQLPTKRKIVKKNHLARIRTSRGSARMIVRVVISRTTLVPAVSFSLSTLLRHPTTYLGPLLALTITVALKVRFINWLRKV